MGRYTRSKLSEAMASAAPKSKSSANKSKKTKTVKSKKATTKGKKKSKVASELHEQELEQEQDRSLVVKAEKDIQINVDVDADGKINDNDSEGNDEDNVDDSDDEDSSMDCVFIEKSADASKSAQRNAVVDLDSSQDDIEAVGGGLEIQSYPHLRRDCLQFGKSKGAKTIEYCELCFCSVCNLNVKGCSNWSAHCDMQSQKITKNTTSNPVTHVHIPSSSSTINSRIVDLRDSPTVQIMDHSGHSDSDGGELSDEDEIDRSSERTSFTSFRSSGLEDEEVRNHIRQLQILSRVFDPSAGFSQSFDPTRYHLSLNPDTLFHDMQNCDFLYNGLPVYDKLRPKCNCNYSASRKITKKAGLNQGRPFYVCPFGPGEDSCGYFLWESDALLALQASNSPSVGSKNNNLLTSLSSSSSSNTSAAATAATTATALPSETNTIAQLDSLLPVIQAPKCQCNELSKRLITKKEGPNHGRAFYTCAVKSFNQNNGCKYFEWEDKLLKNASKTPAATTNAINSNNSNNAFSSSSSSSTTSSYASSSVTAVTTAAPTSDIYNAHNNVTPIIQTVVATADEWAQMEALEAIVSNSASKPASSGAFSISPNLSSSSAVGTSPVRERSSLSPQQVKCFACNRNPADSVAIHDSTSHLVCWNCALRQRGNLCPQCKVPIDHVARLQS